MTYLQFHLVFILPPLLLLLATIRRPASVIDRSLLLLPGLAVIALVYTTPWDNYLVWREVWSYSPARVLGTIGFVPIEEYAFFLLQPLLTGAWLYHVMARVGAEVTDPGASRWIGTGLYAAAFVIGGALLGVERGLYAGLILVWSAPVLLAQWALGGDEFWRRRRAFAVAVAVPTVYLWLADWVAIRQGIWRISEQYTIGWSLAGLPFEEALFFLVTNLLVIQGLMLFLDPPPRVLALVARLAGDRSEG